MILEKQPTQEPSGQLSLSSLLKWRYGREDAAYRLRRGLRTFLDAQLRGDAEATGAGMVPEVLTSAAAPQFQ